MPRLLSLLALVMSLQGCSAVIVGCGEGGYFRRVDDRPYCVYPPGPARPEGLLCPAQLPVLVLADELRVCTDRVVEEVPCEIAGCGDAGL